MGIRVERKGDIFKEFNAVVLKMSDDLVDDLKKRTPVKTGKARDGWINRSSGKGRIVISNRVKHTPYLDAGGHNGPSKPYAPKGMTKPAMKELQRQVSRGKYKMKRRK
jgi:hypothetical protein